MPHTPNPSGNPSGNPVIGPTQWIPLLDTLARRAAPHPEGAHLPAPAGFLHRVSPTTPAARPVPDLDDELWGAVGQESTPALASRLQTLCAPGAPDSTPAPLVPHPPDTPLEVWTETELCALHALWWVAAPAQAAGPSRGTAGRGHQRTGQPRAAVRTAAAAAARAARSAARWHLEHTQPDNATNRPWALHVFAELARSHARSKCAQERELSAQAELYAHTLLHNCQVQEGRPDALSGLILADSAAALRRRCHAVPA